MAVRGCIYRLTGVVCKEEKGQHKSPESGVLYCRQGIIQGMKGVYNVKG